MASKKIGFDSLIEHIATRTPFDYLEVDSLMTKCRTLYYPVDKAVAKCVIVLDTAQELGISIDEALTMQKVIDFELL